MSSNGVQNNNKPPSLTFIVLSVMHVMHEIGADAIMGKLSLPNTIQFFTEYLLRYRIYNKIPKSDMDEANTKVWNSLPQQTHTWVWESRNDNIIIAQCNDNSTIRWWLFAHYDSEKNIIVAVNSTDLQTRHSFSDVDELTVFLTILG